MIDRFFVFEHQCGCTFVAKPFLTMRTQLQPDATETCGTGALRCDSLNLTLP